MWGQWSGAHGIWAHKFGHTPRKKSGVCQKVACAHFGNGTWIPQSFTNITSPRAPYICIILSQSNRIKYTWTRRLHHMYHVNTVALQVLWTQTYTYDTNIITFSSQLKDVCPNRTPLFQLATLHRYEMPMKAKKDMSIFWLKDPSICFHLPENCESEGSDALPGRQSKKIAYAEA